MKTQERAKMFEHDCNLFCDEGVHTHACFSAHEGDEDRIRGFFKRDFGIDVIDVRRVECPIPADLEDHVGFGNGKPLPVAKWPKVIAYGVRYRAALAGSGQDGEG